MRAAIVCAYRHAMARLDEPALRLVLLGLERVRMELEHLQAHVQDLQIRLRQCCQRVCQGGAAPGGGSSGLDLA